MRRSGLKCEINLSEKSYIHIFLENNGKWIFFHVVCVNVNRKVLTGEEVFVFCGLRKN